MRRTLQYTTLAFAVWSTACSANEGELPTSDAGTDGAVEADGEGDASSAPLIEHESWTAVAEGDDPFDDRPTTVDCERGLGWGVEDLEGSPTVEVATGSCNYLGLEQPLVDAVRPGERLTVHLIHFQLTGDGEAHAAIAVGGDVLWEKTIPLPQPEFQVYEEQFEVPNGADAGSQVVFHLHNHGLNTYNLIDIRR